EGDGHHHHGEWDPHAWLGIDQAILMVQQIAKTLKETDPGNASNYDARAAKYVQKLQELQKYGKDKLAGKSNHKLVAMHEQLAYSCRSFDLELIDSIRPRPGIEADLPKLAELQEICRQKDVRLIAVEPQYRQSGAAEKLQAALKQKGHNIELVEVDP